MRKLWSKHQSEKQLSRVERLEPRILYSADSLAGLTPMLYPHDSVEHEHVSLLTGALNASSSSDVYLVDELIDRQIAGSDEQSTHEALAKTATISEQHVQDGDVTTPDEPLLAEEPVRHVVFLDSALPDSLLLSDSLSSSHTKIVAIQGDEDALLTITRTLAGHSSLDSIQIFSHGEAGVLHLGKSPITEQSLANNSVAIQSWGASMIDGADILLYGCDVAGSESGKSFVRSMADLTGADVAASVDLTGHVEHGGDWDLEYSTGEIDQRITLHQDIRQLWTYTLATISVDIFTDEFTIADGTTLDQLLLLQAGGLEDVSLREAVYAAGQGTLTVTPNTADDDQILLSNGTYQVVGDPGQGGKLGDIQIEDDLRIVGNGSGNTQISLVSGNDRIFDVERGNFTLEGVYVSGGNHANSGGAIYGSLFTNIDIVDSNFTNNYSDGTGGAIFSFGDVSIDGSSISGNSARLHGGAIEAATVTISNSAIDNNRSNEGDGGAIRSLYVSVADTSLNGNSSLTGSGGTIYSFGDVVLTDFGIGGSTAYGEGGAVYAAGAFDLQRGGLTNNESTTMDGGGIYSSGANAAANAVNQLYAVSLFDNSAGDDGGAVYSAIELSVSYSDFQRNTATDDGGAIYTDSAMVVIADSSFLLNAAPDDGGAIHSENELSITRSSFVQNESSTGLGGAIYHNTNAQFTVSLSTFSGNAATQGGAIYTDKNVEVTRSTFVGNSSSNDGAAIYHDANDDQGTINNSIFSGNVEGGPNNNTIAGAKSGSVDGSLNSNVTSNGFNLADFDLPGNIAGDISNTDALIGALARASSDPLNTVMVYELLSGSPAINAGGPVAAGATDAGGNLVDEQADIGAYEYAGNESVVFWTDGSSIFRSNSDFTNVQTLDSGRNTATSIAADLQRSQLFWLEENGSQIVTLDFNDSNVVQVWSAVTDATSIAIDTAAAHLYVAFGGANARIDRYDLTTKLLIDTVVSANINAPVDLEVHANTGKLYWADSGGNGVAAGVYSANNAGGDEALLQSVNAASGIAVNTLGTHLYWSDQDTDRVVRFDLGANVESALADSSVTDPGGITFDSYSNSVIRTSDLTGQIDRLSSDLSTTEASHVDGSSSIEVSSAVTSNSLVPVVLVNNTLTLSEGQLSVPIDQSFLNSTDPDATDVQITYSVKSGLDAGNLVVNGLEGAITFTQQDLIDDVVRYRNTDESATSDAMALTVSDGVNESNVFIFNITIFPVNDPPVLTARPGIVDVAESSVSTLTVADLVSSDDDNSTADFRYRLTSLPGHGGLFVDGTEMALNDTFTYDQLNTALVEYRPGDDEFTGQVDIGITLSDQSLDSSEGTLSFNVTAINDSPVLTAQPNRIDVAEAGSYVVLLTDLVSTDEDNPTSDFVYRVNSGALSGDLYRDTTALGVGDTFTYDQLRDGRISFQPGEDEFTGDVSVDIVLSDQVAESATGTLQFNITATNDRPVLVAQSNVIDVAESSAYTLLITDLVSSDDDNSTADFRYRLTSLPGHGGLFVEGTEMGLNDTFTYDQLNTALVEYRPGDDEFTGSVTLDIVLSDQFSDSATGTLSFNVLPFNDTPQITVSGNDVAENVAGALAGTLTAVDEDPASITYQVDDARFELVGNELRLRAQESLDYEAESSFLIKIIAIDNEGAEITLDHTINVLDRNDAPVSANSSLASELGDNYQLPSTTFTDQDNDSLTYSATLASGAVLPDWLEFEPVSREFKVTDPDRVSSSLMVRISASDLRGGSASVDIQLIFIPILSAALPEIEAPIETVEAIGLAEQKSPESALLQEALAIDAVEARLSVTDPLDGDQQSANPLDLRELIQPLKRFGSLQLAEINETGSRTERVVDKLALQIDVNTLNLGEFLSLQQRVSLTGFERIASEADAQQEDWNERNVSWQTLVGSSVGLTSGLSVGYLIWLIRGGTLMGSVLSSLPAWRFVDPLPVLGTLSDGIDEDDESLESMVEDSQASDDDTHKPQVSK